MSNTWIPEGGENKDFDLFAPNTDDNLQEVLAKGAYRWTNKFTAIFAAVLVIVTSVSGGIWYGHRSATSSPSTGIAGLSGFSRSGFTRGSGTGGISGAGAAAFGGGGFGGSRVPGTVTAVKGNTITITADSDPSTTVKTGDTVSVRVSGVGAGAPQDPTGAAPATTSSTTTKSSTKNSSSTQSNTATAPTGTAPTGAPRAGGFTQNPEFISCLKKNGVTVVAGQRLDRTDPKVSSALQACFSTLGGGFGGGQRGGAVPAPSSTTNP